MKPTIRPRVVLILGSLLVASACMDPVSNDAAAVRRPIGRGEEAPPNGGMFGSGHTSIPGGGTLTVTAESDTTGKNGGMFGSGH